MIGWVHQRAKEWGRWRQRNEPAWSSKSLMGRIQEEGSVGAAIKQHNQHIPVKLMPKEIADFHRAWLGMDERQRALIDVVYRLTIPRAEKPKVLGISQARMYQLLDQCHGFLSARMAEHGDSWSERVSRISTFEQARNAK